MLKLSVTILVLVGVAVAEYQSPFQSSIKGYGLVSPLSKHRAAVAGNIPQRTSAPAYPSGPISTKGGSKFVQPAYRPRPPIKIGPVNAAIITSRAQEVIEVPVSEDVVTPQIVIIEPNMTPVIIEFRSRSSPVSIQQVHIPGQRGQTKTTRSQEQPDRVIHEVVKPVIQEVREIIQPFRKITQQILPVQEEVLSVVSKGERRQTLEKVEVPRVEIPEEPVVEEVQQEEQGSESAPTSSLLGSGTIVQAGLIGGARILPDDDSAALLSAGSRRSKGFKNRK